MPKDAKKYIGTWKRYCNDYEIVEWNEENFDVSQNQYCMEAYKEKKWAFVTDYVRLKVLYEYGGIYMDSDVEVVKKLDDLLMYDAFTGFESDQYIVTGTMGACARNEWIKLLLESYDNRKFILEDGSFDFTTNTVTITQVTQKHYNNIKLDGSFQMFGNNIALLPFECLCAKNAQDRKIYCTDKTYTIHHFAGSWVDDKDYIIRNQKKYIEFLQINEENRWVKMAAAIPWHEIRNRWSEYFSDVVCPKDVDNVRLIVATLLIKEKYGYSDTEMAFQIAENKYYQHFIGINVSSKTVPIPVKTIIYFRKRCTDELLQEIKFFISEKTGMFL